MRRRGPWAAACLAAAWPALAQPAPEAAVPARAVDAAPPNAAVAALLDQAARWQAAGRPADAARVLERVLRADPAEPAALAALAEARARLGEGAAAEAVLARLRAAAPDAPRTREAEALVRVLTIAAPLVAEARRLAAADRPGEAVARYREAFGDAPPPDILALEYWETLAGTPEGHAPARDGLARLAARRPGDAGVRLALARVLTRREATRADGLDRLRRLAAPGADGTVAAAARAAWREALLWQGADPAAAPAYEAYLAQVPDDAAVRAALAAARTPRGGPADPAGQARANGFGRLDAGRLGEAEAGFRAALARDDRDAEALGGLGLVRLRQGRPAEARRLLARASALDPAGSGRWARALEGASFAVELAAGRARLAAGDLAGAEGPLRRAARRPVPGRADAEALLGEAALRRGDPVDAEARHRAALGRRPGLPAAVAGLHDALRAQGRVAEAEAVAPRLAAGAAAARAAALRADALAAPDPDRAADLLALAVDADPADPWARLDLARLLAARGQDDAARGLVEPPAAATAEALHAAALFADEQDRPAEAAAWLERLPPRARTPDRARLLARARGEAAVLDAAALAPADPDEARARLLTLAARPDPDGAVAPRAVRALATLGDPAAALEAARLAPGRDAAARLALAGALAEAGLEGQATALADAVEAGGKLTADDAAALARLREAEVVRAADALNERGERAAARAALAPALDADAPGDGAVLALARLHQAASDPAAARRLAEAVVARSPRDLDARLTAADAALAQGDRAAAEAHLAAAREAAPADPRTALIEGRVAAAGGDPARAARAFERARERRLAQLGVAAGPPEAGARALPLGARPARAALPTTDRLAGVIDRELEAAREAAAVRGVVALGARRRSGTAGLDALEEATATFEASAPLPGTPGRLAVRVTPTQLDAGPLGADPGTLRRLGTLPLAAEPGTLPGGRDALARGVGLGAAWSGRGVALDVGTTPLGFRETAVVGGIEVAPLLADGLRLRLTAERRAVTDSVLSWAGARDPGTGLSWGGVTRAGGRAQLEYAAGPWALYAGGGAWALDGEGVASNTRAEAGAGLAYALLRRPGEELLTGLDLAYSAHRRNLRHFTLGHGGYFSPGRWASVGVPLDWRARRGDLTWHLGGTVGWQDWREGEAPLFPRDDRLQAAAEARAAAEPGLATRYAGRAESGFAGGARGSVELALTPTLRLGATLRHDRAGDWHETRGLVYARYRLD